MSQDIIIDDSFSKLKEAFEKELAKRKPKSKGLTPDLKRAHWERYAQKTARQEVAFKRVFDNVFEGQKKFVVEEYQRTGQLPDGLNDKETAQKFQPVIELVYHSAFEDAVASKTVKQIDEFARNWIAERSLLLAKSINQTTLKALKDLFVSFEAGTTVAQAAKKIEHWFADNEKWKAEMIARTETIAVNNEAVLHRFELENIEKSEWFASPSACVECDDENGKIYLTKESHNLIPKHPNCKCMWLGVVE